MANMEWNKYPETAPTKNDEYLVVVEYEKANGTRDRYVRTLLFTNDLAESSRLDFEDEHRPGWFDTWEDLFYGREISEEFDNVTYWMPFPELPTE